ncbi:MAG: hypothetical protein EBV95_06740, partial [Actinobacteria bacterium]|nr:hypothetical protein [Actinomycetota bacterium]
DSIVTLNLTVNQPSATTINQSICAPNSYTFDGQTLTTSGTYMDTLTNAAGCDSIITLNLTVNQPSASTISQTICAPNSYSFNGQSYNASGTYTATLSNAVGCDSVITLNLTVVDVQITQEPSSSLSLVEGTTGSLSVTATGATSYEWQVLLSGTWTSLSNGATYSGATTSALGITVALSLNGFQYRVVVTGAAGCSDTSQTSTLTVTPALSRVIRIDALTACIGDTIDVPLEAEDFVGVSGLSLVIDYDGQSLSYQGYTSVGLNGGTLSVQGSATGSQVRLGWFDIVPSQLGDGQLLRLRFAVNGTSALTFDTQTSGNCELADSLGQVITGVSFVSGGVTAGGVTMSDTVEVCLGSTLNYGGQSFGTQGTYTVILPSTTGGCDTLVSLLVVVKQPSATTITQSICVPNSYSFNGQSYSATGTYTATLTNAVGCDSIVTLNLTVNQP